jgi:hypothetical protein
MLQRLLLDGRCREILVDIIINHTERVGYVPFFIYCMKSHISVAPEYQWFIRMHYSDCLSISGVDTFSEKATEMSVH